jgi:hypothetical protein
MVNFNINGFENINFQKIKTDGKTSDFFLDSEKKFFIKIPKKYLEYDILKREIFIYKFLSEKNINWIPKLLYHDDKLLILEYSGEKINFKNIPDNYIEQFDNIIHDLNNLNLKHNDIYKPYDEIELLVKDNKIYLYDFAWCSINNDFSCGQEI